MAFKIETYTSFNEALKQSGELSFEMTVELLSRMSFGHVLELLKTKIAAVAEKLDGEKLAILLQMVRQQYGFVCAEEFVHKPFQYAHDRQRAAEREAVVRFRGYLAELFWQLPDTRQEQLYVRDQDGSRYDDGHATRQALPETKRFIFRELLTEWTSEPTTQSVYAFRRAIAMGWPLSSQFKQKFEGEHDIELAARGRYISAEEQKQYVSAIRSHLEGFDSFESRQKGADAVYGPWLLQKRVPEDIEKLLAIARSKMGGVELARRDLRYGAILSGLPTSAEQILSVTALRMRALQDDAECVIDALIVGLARLYPRYDARRNLPRSIELNRPDYIVLEVGGCNDAQDMALLFGEAVSAITDALAKGAFAGCSVELRVRSRYDDGTTPLLRLWEPQEK